MTADELIARIAELVPDAACHVDRGHAVAEIKPDKAAEAFRILKTDDLLFFDLFMDLTAVDWPERRPRFDVVYHLYSVKNNHRLRIKVKVAEGESVPTATGLWPIADWMEREVWDLYGIKFAGRPNLKRLLLYEEFKGHPLRKDYPYDKRQPLEPETWPVREQQVQMKGLKIHRP
jgi:NADH-quinone oxidoreductase subunit C